VASLTDKYAESAVSEKTRAFEKDVELKHKSEEGLRGYAKRAKRLSKKMDPTYVQFLAKRFIDGSQSMNLGVLVAANSHLEGEYNFKVAYLSITAIVRANKGDSDSESESDTSSMLFIEFR
jgi:hypothetical protein